VMTIDNEALYGICKKTLKLSSPKCKRPEISHVRATASCQRSGERLCDPRGDLRGT
jgi:hypothetical protein